MSVHVHIAPGEEASFAVHRRRRKLARIIVDSGEYTRHLLALKRAVPEFVDVSISKVREMASGPSLEFGPFPVRDAEERLARFKKEGLDARIMFFIDVGDLLVDERGPAAWLIEDPSESRRVIDDAIRRGVRVIEHEEA